MPAYDTTLFNPPAPVASITLRNKETGAIVLDVPMLLDSGADITLIPQNAVASLGLIALPDKHYELIGFDGNTSFAPVVQLELLFCQKTFRGQFLIVDQAWGILGRNVLNAVRLLFNGPNLTWDEQHT